TAKLWDVTSGRLLADLRGQKPPIMAVAFSPDGDTLATTSTDRTVKLWNLRLKQDVLTLSGHTAHVDAAAFSPDGNRLATGSNDSTVRLWRAATFEEADVAPVCAFSGSGSDRSVTLQWRPV